MVDGRQALYVDSDRERSVAVESGLEAAGLSLTVRTAADRAAALDALSVDDFECVVVAHRPDGLDGPALVEALRDADASIPVVFTGEDDGASAAAIEAGATSYVPADGEEGIGTLAEWIRTNVGSGERAGDCIEASDDGLDKRSFASDDGTTGRWSDRQFEAVFQDPQLLIGVLAPDGTLHAANDTAMQYVEADREDVLGAPFWETPWWTDDVRDDVRAWVERAADGEYVEYEADHVVSTGVEYSVEGTIRPVMADGAVTSLVVSARDVTDRRDREEKLNALHDATRSFMAASDRESVADRVVRTARDVLDLPINGLWLYDSDRDALVPETRSEESEELIDEQPTYTGEGSLSWNAFQDGEVRVYDDVGERSGLKNPDTAIRSEMVVPLGEYGVLNAGSPEPGAFDDMDVSMARILGETAEAALERAAREQELRTQRRTLERVRDRMSFALDETDTILWDLNLETGQSTTHGPLERLFGHDTDGMADFVDTVVHEDDRDELEALYDAVRRGETDVFEAEYRVALEGDTTRWMHAEGFVRESQEDSRHLIGFATDVTERKQREREIRRQNERLEQFASIVSHDLRNPLTTAMGRLELVADDCESEHVPAVEGALDRMADILDEMLRLIRHGRAVGDREMVDLGYVARQCWNTVGLDDATLSVGDLPSTRADPDGVKHIFENLFGNAVEHGDGEVAIRVGELDGRDGFYVADDGPGVPEAVRDEAFELGYTTKDGGTGFGLAIVDEIAEEHGWDVEVTESDAGGARFEFTDLETR